MPVGIQGRLFVCILEQSAQNPENSLICPLKPNGIRLGAANVISIECRHENLRHRGVVVRAAATCKEIRLRSKDGSQVSILAIPGKPRRHAAGDFRHAREPAQCLFTCGPESGIPSAHISQVCTVCICLDLISAAALGGSNARPAGSVRRSRRARCRTAPLRYPLLDGPYVPG